MSMTFNLRIYSQRHLWISAGHHQPGVKTPGYQKNAHSGLVTGNFQYTSKKPSQHWRSQFYVFYVNYVVKSKNPHPGFISPAITYILRFDLHRRTLEPGWHPITPGSLCPMGQRIEPGATNGSALSGLVTNNF